MSAPVRESAVFCPGVRWGPGRRLHSGRSGAMSGNVPAAHAANGALMWLGSLALRKSR